MTQLLGPVVEEAGPGGRPGTNFTQVSPGARKKLDPLIKHYMGQAHPFAACKRDQLKHGLSEQHANGRCAVLKDLGTGTTKWRKGGRGGGNVTEADELVEQWVREAEERIAAVNETLGEGAAVALAESERTGDRERDALAELCFADFGLLYLCGKSPAPTAG